MHVISQCMNEIDGVVTCFRTRVPRKKHCIKWSHMTMPLFAHWYTISFAFNQYMPFTDSFSCH